MNKASPVKRLIAYFLDGVIQVGIIFVLSAVVGDSSAIFLGLFLNAIIQFFMWSKGSSIGKSALGLQVVNINTEIPLGFGMMFLREFIGKWISGLVFSLGYIWILIDSNNQGWHDKLVSSIVVEK